MLRLVLVLYTSLCLACVGTCFAGSSKAKKPITLVTLDVDGTLLSGHSDAARKSVHAKAFNYAICKVFQPETKEKDGYVWSDEFATPEMVIPSEKYHGCTDGLIALNLAKYGFGVSSSEAFPKLEAVFGEMFDYVSKRSDEEVANGIEALPGVIDTLRVLAKNENILVGLVTGNVEGIARKKMRSCGITQTGALSPASPEQQKHWEGFMDEDSSFLGGVSPLCLCLFSPFPYRFITYRLLSISCLLCHSLYFLIIGSRVFAMSYRRSIVRMMNLYWTIHDKRAYISNVSLFPIFRLTLLIEHILLIITIYHFQ